MTRIIECPACEASFSASVDDDPTLCSCPHCRYEFAPTSNLTPTAAPPTVDLPTHAPRRVRERNRVPPPAAHTPALTTPAPSDVPASIPDNPVNSVAAADDQQTESQPVISKTTHARRFLWVSSSVAVVTIIAAVTIIIWQLNQSTNKSTAQPTPTAETDSVTPPVPSFASSEPAVPAATSGAAQNEFNKLQFLTRQQYFELWSQLYPHIVRLKIHTPSGIRIAGGVIIDSRGWVVTSLRSVRDAIRIEVATAAKSLDTGPAYGDFSDDARGLLAEDPAHDLAIVEINRRMVTAFSNIPLGKSDYLLGGARVFGIAPPAEESRLWIFDCPIRDSGDYSELPDNLKSIIEQHQLDQTPNSDWVIHAADEKRSLPGTPLVSQNGEFVGLLTGWSAGGTGLAIPKPPIQNLVASVRGTARPFPVDAAAIATVEMAQQIQSGMQVAASLQNEQLGDLLRLQTAVQEFGLFSTDAQQYGTLQSFAQAVVELDSALASGEIPPEQSAEIQQLVDQQMDQFDALLRQHWPRFQFDVGSFNQIAWDAFSQGSSGAGLVAAVRVARSGLLAPTSDGSPTVIFQLIDGEHHLITRVSQQEEIFLPGSRWLIVGTAEPDHAPFIATEPTPITARWCRVLYVFKIGDR